MRSVVQLCRTKANWNNVTEVDDYESPPAPSGKRSPYPRPAREGDCGNTIPACGGEPTCTGAPGEIPCGPWPIASRPAVSGYNTWSQGADSRYRKDCRRGFKNAQSKLTYHGRNGFDYPCDGTYKPSSRWLAEKMEFAIWWAENLEQDQDTGIWSVSQESTAEGTRSSEVNPATGLVSETTHIDPDTELPVSDCVGPNVTPGSELTERIGSYTSLLGAMSNTCGNTLVDYSSVIIEIPYPDSGLEIIKLQNSIVGQVYTVEYRVDLTYTDFEDVEHTLTVETGLFKVTLSGENKLDDLKAAVDSALDAMPLNDDARYPWRYDSKTSVAPIVCRGELPNAGIPYLDWWETCLGVVPTTNDCYTGLTIGGLLPTGYASYFNFDQKVATCCENHHYIQSFGQWSTDSPIPQAKAWTDLLAYMTTNSHLPAGGGWTAWIGDVYWRQKWVEQTCPMPAQNWFGPGGLDRYRVDEDAVTCVISAAGLVIEVSNTLGTISSPTKAYVHAPGLDAGIYEVTGSGTSYTVGTASPLYSAPDTIDYNEGTGDGIIGIIRFPAAPAIAGYAKAKATVASGTVTVTTKEKLWLRTGDNVTLDGTTVAGSVTVTGAYTFTLTGSDLTGYTGRIYTTGAPVSAWSRARRGTAVYFKTGDTSPTECNFAPRSNAVLAITDSVGDTWDNCVKNPIPTPTGSATYAQGAFYQHMRDVFWQTPHKPCVLDPDTETPIPSPCSRADDYGYCNEDTCAADLETGAYSGKLYFATILREATTLKPEGTPELPLDWKGTRVAFNWMDSIALPGVAVFDPETCSQLKDTLTPWGIYNAMKSCACAGGRFAAEYIADNQILSR